MSDPALEAALAALEARGISLDGKAFARFVAGKPQAHLEDLGVAFACAKGQPAAVQLLERVHLAQAERALRKMNLGSSVVEDVMGEVRFELFAREGGALIGTYSGRGALGGWVRAIAVHAALKRAKKQRREVTPEAAADLPVPAVELAALRGAYGAQFTRALDSSFRALPLEQRNLLRQSFLDGLSIDVLAGLLQVHRATAARRVAAAREALTSAVKAQLMRELQLGETSVQEVISLSNLQESLSALLRRTR